MSKFDETKVKRRSAGSSEGGQFDHKDHPSNDDVSLGQSAQREATPKDLPSYTFPAPRLWLAEKRIDEANKRLEKDGIEERFSFTTERFARESKRPDGSKGSDEFVTITLSAPSYSYQGYDFLAAVDREEAGLVVRTALDQDLHGWRPDAQSCEHCNLDRNRNLTYLVRDLDGNIKQVGSTCVKAYTGIQPKGLWSLGFDPLEGVEEEAGDTPERAVSHKEEYGVEDLLGRALAISEGGKKFTSRSSVEASGGRATAEDVLWSFRDTPRREDQERRAEIRAEAQERIKKGEVRELLERIEKLPGKSDWESNIKTLAAGEAINPRHTPTLVSALALLRQERKEKAPRWQPGFAGAVGQSLKGRKMTVRRHQVRTEVDPYSYRGEEVAKSQLVFEDEEGHQVLWWASREIGIHEGDEVIFTSGKVKKHGQYRGSDQTIVERVRLPEKY